MSGNPVILPGSAPQSRVVPYGWGKGAMELVKIHLSLYIAVSAIAGHALAHGHAGFHSLFLGGWVLALACGAAAWNNIQDRRWDRAMPRTRNRVLARKVFPLFHAKAIALGLTCAGLTGLFIFYDSAVPLVLGIIALVCYNGLYTPVKKNSLWAMAPGVVCGMIPPAIGWTAVPEPVASSDASGLILLMAALAFWQLPHYLLVCLKTPLAGSNHAIPGFMNIWSIREIKCQVLIWTVLFSLVMMLFLLRGWVDTPWIKWSVFFTSLALPTAMAGLIQGKKALRHPLLCFVFLNLAMLLFLSAAVLDRI